VAGLIVSKTIGTCTASLEEVTLEKQIRQKLGVVLSVTSNVITPLILVIIVSVNDNAVLPDVTTQASREDIQE
jgi:hypothetical protein